MKSPIHQDTRLAAVAEAADAYWVRLQETAAGAAGRQESDRLTFEGVCYVTISREAGAAGATVARLVGEHLGWEVYDSNLLDQVAQRYKESRLMLDLVDETESNWVYDVLGTWMDRQIIPHEKYVVQVSRMIQVLARSRQRGVCRPRGAIPFAAVEDIRRANRGFGGISRPARAAAAQVRFAGMPWTGFATPTAVAASSCGGSSTTTSTTRTCTTSYSMSSDLGRRAPPIKSSMRCICAGLVRDSRSLGKVARCRVGRPVIPAGSCPARCHGRY